MIRARRRTAGKELLNSNIGAPAVDVTAARKWLDELVTTARVCLPALRFVCRGSAECSPLYVARPFARADPNVQHVEKVHGVAGSARDIEAQFRLQEVLMHAVEHPAKCA